MFANMMKPSNCGRYFAMYTTKKTPAIAVPMVARVTCLTVPCQHLERSHIPVPHDLPRLGLVALDANADVLDHGSCHTPTDTRNKGLISKSVQPASPVNNQSIGRLEGSSSRLLIDEVFGAID